MSSNNSESVFQNSITDLMTSLAVIFILLLIFFIKKECEEAALARALQAESAKAHSTLADVLKSTRTVKEELKRRLAVLGYPAEDDPHDSLAVVYHAGCDKLQFDVDRDELKTDGREYLDRFIPALASVVSDDEIFPQLRSILIEGHTDSDGDDEHNLRLSQGRAFSVLKYSLDGCDLSDTERERFLDLTSINGRGERDLLPEGSSAGDEEKPRSRRVEFKIRVRSFEEKEQYKDLKPTEPAPETPEEPAADPEPEPAAKSESAVRWQPAKLARPDYRILKCLLPVRGRGRQNLLELQPAVDCLPVS
jgi:outer membrane protein OmpA-like peptidoglycan-associated protein